jgi:hypothetical protein
MVQIVENWADLHGTVQSIGDSDKGADFCTVLVEVEDVADVEHFPNLVKVSPGDTVPVIARRDAVERSGVVEGGHVRGRVRKASPFEIFAHPDGFTAEEGGDP